MKKLRFLKIAVILCPVGAAFVAGSVYGFEVRRLHRFEAERAKAEAQMASLERLVKEIEAQPDIVRIPTADQTPQEQAQFLTALRSWAEARHVQLVRWTNVVTAPSSPEAGQATTLPAGVTAIVSNIDVKGRYDDARQFLYDLQRSRRLLTLNNVRWTRGEKWPGTEVFFSLTRYVTPPGKSVVEPRSQSAKPAEPAAPHVHDTHDNHDGDHADNQNPAHN
jgi:hypothetical protein